MGNAYRGPEDLDGYAEKTMLNLDEDLGEVEGGDVGYVVLTADHAGFDGELIGFSRTIIPGHTLGCGVVAEEYPPTPYGSPVVVQIKGLHRAVKVNGTEEELVAGGFVGTHSVAGYAAPVETRDKAIGVYADATYALAAVKKAVFLTNLANLAPDDPVPGHAD